MIGNMRISNGLVLIVGGANAGKTPLAHALAGENDSEYGIVRYGEPLAGYTCDPKVAAAQLALNLIRYPEVVLDSVKDVMALAPGGAMKSGLARSVLPLFTAWATIAANAGATLYVPVNPSSPDEDIINMLIEASKSNSTTTIISNGENRWRYQVRGGEGLLRDEGEFETGYGPDSLMTVGSAGATTSGRKLNVTARTTNEIHDSDFSAAIRRSVKSQTF
jgi:hypothetical protein